MADTPDSGGGVGGSGDSIFLSGSAATCAISPSDLVGTLDNFLHRLEEVEKAVTQLLAQNIWANQLSDLSQQVGWVGNVTYMGVPGWTQTEYGTLIPPAGLSLSTLGIKLSDGNTYQAVVMDENGVLQFGFTPGGTPAGELVDAWNAGGAPDYSIYKFGATLTTNPFSASNGITINSNTFSSSVSAGAIQWTVSQAGLYLINLTGSWTHGTTSGTVLIQPSYTITAGSLLSGTDKHSEEGSYAPWTPSGTLKANINTSLVVKLAADDEASVGMSAGVTGGGTITGTPLQFIRANASIVRLGSAS